MEQRRVSNTLMAVRIVIGVLLCVLGFTFIFRWSVIMQTDRALTGAFSLVGDVVPLGVGLLVVLGGVLLVYDQRW